MDLFTHVLVAYLLTFGLVGFQPSYLAAGALAGGLPDADILFFPLARRFPILRHHGITHSIFGVTVVAIVGGIVIAPHLAPGNPLVYFGVMEAAGLAHMLQDGFTHFSVPPLLPFSERRLELDADRAINLITLVVSVASFYLLLGVERNHVAFPVYLATVYGLMAFYAAYFALRLGARLWVGRHLARYGPYDVPLPTTDPRTWLLLRERKDGGRMRTEFAQYVLGRGVVRGPFVVDVPQEATGASGPVADEHEALERSYPLARRAAAVLDDTFHFGEAHREPDGGWIATWYSLEIGAFGRALGARVRLAADGTLVQAQRGWPVPGWRRRAA